MHFSIKILGASKAARALDKAAKGITGAYRAALYQEGLRVMQQSVPETPIATGRLRNSHWVSPPEDDRGKGWFIRLGYATVYARRQNYEHARKRFYFTKYLEEARRNMHRRIARRTWRLFRAGATMGAISGGSGIPKGKDAARRRGKASARRVAKKTRRARRGR